MNLWRTSWELSDIHDYWTAYHCDGDDHDDYCPLKLDEFAQPYCRTYPGDEYASWVTEEISCDNWDWIEDDCDIWYSYNPCAPAQLSCSRYGYDSNGNYFYADCREEMHDEEMWMMLSDSEVWDQNDSFRTIHDYWTQHHYCGMDFEMDHEASVYDFFYEDDEWEMEPMNPIAGFNDTLNQTLEYVCPDGECLKPVLDTVGDLLNNYYYNEDARAIVDSAVEEAAENFIEEEGSLQAYETLSEMDNGQQAADAVEGAM